MQFNYATLASTSLQLRMAGQNKARWLMVNVQDSKQFASQVLNRDVWSHEGVRTILSKHFLFCQVFDYFGHMFMLCTYLNSCRYTESQMMGSNSNNSTMLRHFHMWLSLTQELVYYNMNRVCEAYICIS